MDTDTEARYVLPGSCTWCGHPPHVTACAAAIRTGKKTTGSCPCRFSEKGAGDA